MAVQDQFLETLLINELHRLSNQMYLLISDTTLLLASPFV